MQRKFFMSVFRWKSRGARKEVSALVGKMRVRVELVKHFFMRCTEMPFEFVRASPTSVRENVH